VGATTRATGRTRSAQVRRRPRRRGGFVPSARSAAVAVGLVAVSAAVYLGAARTSFFAVRAIEVRGGSTRVAAQVRAALRPLVGTSLVRLDGGDVLRRVDALPAVVQADYDRAFPHTLRVEITTERPVAILRQGRTSWLVSMRGRVIRRVPHPRRSSLPRIWVPRSAAVDAGRTLGVADGGRAARALAALSRVPLPAHVRSASADAQRLAFVLASGVELRLGNPRELQLKLAIARRILRRDDGFAYLDVSVPERPVAGMKAQLGG
jgi:cell division protein FtsQ